MRHAPAAAPPPPPVVVIPPLPQPPLGAPDTLTIPPIDANGQRHTVNTGISSTQTIWNLRSAYNVAALNCLKPEQAPILAGYKRFLTMYDKALDNANMEIDRSFQTQLSVRDAARARETYQTQVYNFFALPPVTPRVLRSGDGGQRRSAGRRPRRIRGLFLCRAGQAGSAVQGLL
ncbi:hypothetical protein ACFSTD_16405 [Novosphingobium colocasiae]